MNSSRLARLSRKQLQALLEVSLKDFRTVDGLWFVGVEKRLGADLATEVDEEVWEWLGRRSAFRLTEALGLNGKGLPALVTALELDPCLSMNDYDVALVSARQAVFRCTGCYSQTERLKANKALFDCRRVDEAYFKSFASAIDPRIQVRCDFCPPRHSEDIWCAWYFDLELP
ncbi:MAG: DUF6125 family protein [Dehalococcoidia bacterium]|nr:DUF6125 family protein [Dehalococcoidia bacterium]